MPRLCFLADRPTGYVYTPDERIVMKIADGSTQAHSRKGVTLQFKKIEGGLPCASIAAKDDSGRAYGILWVDEAAAETGLTEKQILDFFLTGKKAKYHGAKYVLADDNGNPIDPESADGLTAEVPSNDWRVTDSKWVSELPNNTYYCKACDLKMTRGISGHVKSKRHLAKTAEAKKAIPGAAERAPQEE